MYIVLHNMTTERVYQLGNFSMSCQFFSCVLHSKMCCIHLARYSKTQCIGFFRMHNCMHTIVTTSGYCEPDMYKSYTTCHGDVCTAPTAVCSSSPHSRPR